MRRINSSVRLTVAGLSRVAHGAGAERVERRGEVPVHAMGP